MVVTLKGSGSFYCLKCEQKRDYEHHAWRTKGILTYFLQPEAGWREFILCCICESVFDVECLDESSDAYLEELILNLPDHAIPRPRTFSPVIVEHESASTQPENSHRARGEELRVSPKPNALVAYSPARRH